jgi:hypothetical protein
MEIGRRIRTGSFDKTRIVLGCQQGVGQIPEELLEESSNTIHIMEKVRRVSKIYLRRIYY